ncbi:MAG: hypothetical protein AABZ50_02985 [Pseudomonadota bacterium]
MKRLSLLIALLLSPTTLPAATEVTAELGADKSLDFGVRFAAARNPLAYGSATHDTTVRWIGAGWREAFGPAQIGLRFGYTFVTQNDNPNTAGLELDGYHAGISLAFDIVRYAQGRLFVSTDYLYQAVKHEGISRTVEMTWYDPRVTVGLYHGLSREVYVLVGASYGRTNGEERVNNGVVTTVRDFSRHDTGSLLGFDIVDGNKGTVGFVLRTGLDRGGSIYFKRLF